MGPITYTTDMELPVERPDQPARNESASRGEQDRRGKRGRRRQRDPEPKPDEFQHREDPVDP